MIWILANWKTALGIAGTAVFAALLLITTIDRNQWRAAARKANDTLALVKPAQELALAKAQAAIAAKEAYYKEQANAADQNYATAVDDARSATDRYIAAHRVPVCPASGAASTAPARPQGNSAQGSDGPGTAPYMVAVSPEDVSICTSNTLRLEAGKAWAEGL